MVVVDDDPDYLWVVRFILESGPDQTAIVGEAGSGEEALELVLQKHPDIVIVDLMMPRLNGLELTRRIKQVRPQTKILLMSAYTEDTYRRIASVSGADGFVNKNLIQTALLLRSARSWSGRRQPCMNLRHPLLHPPDLPF